MTMISENETEINLPLPNGGFLRCDAGTERKYGGSLHILDAEGNEVLMWDSAEWGEDPEGVIGAVFAAAAKPIPELLTMHGLTVVEDGCWLVGPSSPDPLTQKD